jgi:RNA polymerase sigma-70 factor (ECF subfamily)
VAAPHLSRRRPIRSRAGRVVSRGEHGDRGTQRAAVDMDTVAESAHRAPTLIDDETCVIAALRAGDESAFVTLIDRYHAGMHRLARVFVRDASVAEEVVQDAWLAVLRGLDRFEARSSLKRWISSILVNHAKSRATRERRCIPFSAVGDPGAEPVDPSVEPERFRPDDAPQWRGG